MKSAAAPFAWSRGSRHAAPALAPLSKTPFRDVSPALRAARVGIVRDQHNRLLQFTVERGENIENLFA
jgi:hypothetical protein